jgi:hypothetical protein
LPRSNVRDDDLAQEQCARRYSSGNESTPPPSVGTPMALDPTKLRFSFFGRSRDLKKQLGIFSEQHRAMEDWIGRGKNPTNFSSYGHLRPCYSSYNVHCGEPSSDLTNNFRKNLVRILAIAAAGRKATTELVVLPLTCGFLRRRWMLKPPASRPACRRW